MIAIRCHYTTGAGDVHATIIARSGPAPAWPGLMNLCGALTALRNRISARIQPRKQSACSFAKCLSAFSVCVAHVEKHARERIVNVRESIGEVENV